MTTDQQAAGDAGDNYEDFDEVFGSAIDVAVRRAIDRVGRDPLADLDPGTGTVEPESQRAAPPEPGTPQRHAPIPLPRGDLAGIDPYAVLGVSRSASWSRVTEAYRQRARAWHPDGADPAEADRRQELIRQLNDAYTRLRATRGRQLH